MIGIQHVSRLDGLRGLAFLFVILSHADNVHLAFFQGYLFGGGGSQLGVRIFFVLSAFLLSLQFFSIKRYDYSFLFSYLSRRFLRIYPIYILFLIIFVFMYRLEHLSLNSDFYSYLLLDKSAAHFWTVNVEFKYYLFLPVVCYITSKLGLKNSTILTVLIVTIFAFARTNYEGRFLVHRESLWTSIDFFITGTYLAYYYNLSMNKDSETTNNNHFSQYLVLICLLLLFILIPLNMIHIFDFHTRGYTIKVFNAALPIIACLLFSLATFKGQIIDLLFSNRFSRFLGKISYSGYAWHYPILLVYFMNLNDYFSRYGKASTVISYYVVTLAVATASHFFIEKPFYKLYPTPDALKSFIASIRQRS